MQNPPRYTLTRRILFPYSGEEPLTRKQGLRVILAWALLFPTAMSLCILVIAAAGTFSFYRTIMVFLFSFLLGFILFGALGCVVVSMSNRAAHIRLEWKARKGNQ